MNKKKYILRNSTGTDVYDLVHLSCWDVESFLYCGDF